MRGNGISDKRGEAAMISVRTKLLDVKVILGGSQDGIPVLLIHGWPDDATTWDQSRRFSTRHASGPLRQCTEVSGVLDFCPPAREEQAMLASSASTRST
jgi:pimeloyl-ACP methyl ester carboxylesterase